MQKLKRIILGLPILVLALSVTTGVVHAHNGEDHGASGSSGHSAEPEDRSGSTDKSKERVATDRPTSIDDKKGEIEQEARANQERFRRGGDELLNRLRNARKEIRTAEQRKKNCEVRKDGLQGRLGKLDNAAKKYQQRIDEVLAKIIDYQKDKGLAIDDFDSLVATAQAAQTKSAASTQALAALKPTVDCSKDTVASDVAAFKEAATQARTDLSAYKKAVKNLLKAAESAKKQGA